MIKVLEERVRLPETLVDLAQLQAAMRRTLDRVSDQVVIRDLGLAVDPGIVVEDLATRLRQG